MLPDGTFGMSATSGGAPGQGQPPLVYGRAAPYSPHSYAADPRPYASGPPPRTAFRRQAFRWVASRPPEAMPAPREQPRTRDPRIPRYRFIPQWGLPIVPVTAGADTRRSAHEVVSGWLSWLLPLQTALLVGAGVTQLWIYILLAINRSHPISAANGAAALALNWLFGTLSVIGMVALGATLIVWLREERRRRYRRHGLRDPRPWWQLVVGVAVPVVNLVWPAAFFHELVAQADDDPTPVRTRTLLRRWWLGWVLVNLAVYVTVLMRIVSSSVQWQANAMLLLVLCDFAGAAFTMATWWMWRNVIEPSSDRVPATRWVPAT
ncbi:hypothetical protein GCM10027169_21270 [Gordonia jinhuaensis]|uniref:DUF4328 domain-containing protein n=1 Tax=Gordonia jinhuaensis TaxID=1517702 RepID=A0A916TFG3_9ACTN|nr:DUF4328 domain-containing protein [Gordonia jinhuaensis]GGB43268.1 hypothetical protein GCM10011489_33480 [Gordonia jinhuaensis]